MSSKDFRTREFLESQIEAYTALINQHKGRRAKRGAAPPSWNRKTSKRRKQPMPSSSPSVVATSTPTGMFCTINGAKYVSRDGGESYHRIGKRVKDGPKEEKIYCKFYTKMGTCLDGDNCPFVHDDDKVTACRKFLRGECTDDQCTLSHPRSAQDGQVPVCSFFLRGVCTKEDCPYLHVYVAPEDGPRPKSQDAHNTNESSSSPPLLDSKSLGSMTPRFGKDLASPDETRQAHLPS